MRFRKIWGSHFPELSNLGVDFEIQSFFRLLFRGGTTTSPFTNQLPDKGLQCTEIMISRLPSWKKEFLASYAITKVRAAVLVRYPISFSCQLFDFLVDVSTYESVKGVFLFDGSIDSATGKRLTDEFVFKFKEPPQYPTHDSTLPMPRTPLYNMRDVLLSTFSGESVPSVLTDESTILWTILRATVAEWLEHIKYTEVLLEDEMMTDSSDFYN